MQQLALLLLAIVVIVWLCLKLGGKLIVFLIIGALVGVTFVFVFVHTAFSPLQDNEPVATVVCHSPQPHVMLVQINNGLAYALPGDRWMLQTSVIEVQPWMYFLGVQSGYTLDRLDSQFDDPNHETAKPIILNGFSLYKSTDAWMYFPLIKSAYGNAVIQGCDGRQYSIFVDASGDMSARRQ